MFTDSKGKLKMSHKIFGRITAFNQGNTPIEGLRVQAWDDDWPDGDDFLGEAVTNAEGVYTILYSDAVWNNQESGASDYYPDIYITVDIRNSKKKWVRVGKSQVFKDHNLGTDLQINLEILLELPVSSRTGFEIARHGFQFRNRFLIDPSLLGLTVEKWPLGFCGGMCAGALVRYLNRQLPPPDASTPLQGTTLFAELLKRQVKSMGPELLAKMYDWQSAPDVSQPWRKASIGQRTKQEWPFIKSELDNQRPVILVLIRSSGYLGNWTLNHQVLAVGYEYNPTTKDLVIEKYDPNFPGTIHTLYVNLGLPEGSLMAKDSTGDKLRGFFINPASQAAMDAV
jgi:hypothetical protein